MSNKNQYIKPNYTYKYVDLPDIDMENEDSIELYIEMAKSVFPRNTVLYERTKIPKFDNPIAQKNWEMEEVRRCKYGYGTMSGIMYFYYNYCWIKEAKKGYIRPDYWHEDSIYFDIVMSCMSGRENEGSGVINVKKRRAGFSWKAAALSLWSCLFNKANTTGMTSKTERDAIDLFKKVREIYEKLPTFMKHPLASNTQESMLFARKTTDALGNRKLEGNQSELMVRPPTDTAFEGQLLNWLFIDEIGKISNAETIWSMSEPCLMQGTERVGVPILFGTAGEQEGMGAAQRKLWNSADENGFIKFFFAGWCGMNVDKYGNPDIEKNVYWIMRKRRQIKDKKKLIDFIQQYPLTIKEAFLSSGKTSLGNTVNIFKQINELEKTPPKFYPVKFRQGSDGINGVVAEANILSDMRIYEQPSSLYEYVAGCDPADHNHTTDKDVSNLSMYIMKKPVGAEAPTVVFSYTARPDRVEEFYDNSIMALTYYNNAKVLIENNRYGMIQHFELGGFHHLLRNEPAPKNKFVLSHQHQLRVGVRKGVSSTQEMERCINQYTDTYCDLIPDLDLLNEFLDYGLKNTDRVVAFGWTLVALEDEIYIRGNKTENKAVIKKNRLRNVNGVLTRVNI